MNPKLQSLVYEDLGEWFIHYTTAASTFLMVNSNNEQFLYYKILIFQHNKTIEINFLLIFSVNYINSFHFEFFYQEFKLF